MRRRFMFASALATLTVFAPAAFADREVTEEVTTPLATSTAGDGGVADNIVISATGRVVLTDPATPAITVDSDNDVTLNGGVNITTDADGGIGIHVQGGNSGTLTISGPIQILTDSIAEDADGDGFVEGDLAVGGNRFGLLVDGADVFTGDILVTGGGSITVRGDNSAGIALLAGLDGSIDVAGRIAVVGDDSRGIDVQNNITGDVFVSGAVAVSGANTDAISIAGNVDGAIAIGGTLSATGYRFLTRPSDEDFDRLQTDAPEVLAQGGSAFLLNGSVANGLLLHGPTEENLETAQADVSVRGAAPAIRIFASAASGNVLIGEVVIPAIADDPDTPDVDESQDEQFLGFSFVNRGQIRASGDLNGINSTGLRIEGGDGFSTTFSDGILNAGLINASAFNGTATAVSIGEGAIIPVWSNEENMLATSVLPDGIAQVLVIEAGANFPVLINDATIFANALLGGDAIAIRDESGTLTSITNSGVISARHEPNVDEDNNPIDDPNFSTIAIDLTATTADTVVRQYRRDDVDEEFQVAIIGDIMLGSGNDELRVESGRVTGDLYFGDGADLLNMSGGSTVAGVLNDSDGDLDIQADDATLLLGAETSATIRTARFGDGAVLQFQVDHELGIAANLNVTDTITFEAGSRVTSSLTSLIGDGASYVVLTANNLIIEEALESLEAVEAPYLYESSLARDPNNTNQLVLTLRRRTADELGMNASQGAAYTAAYNSWQDNGELASAMASLMSESEFFGAYDQLLPEYSASAIQFALASNDSAIGALASRLEAVRRSPDDSAGLWIQEFGYFADRAGTAFGPGYRGQGIGIAVGVDRPAGPFYAVGLNFVGAASEISEIEGVDDPMSAISAQLGAYAGAEVGGMNLDIYGGVGLDQFEHNRRVLIGEFDATPTADWSGYHFASSARLGRDFQSGRFFVRPSVSVDYLHLMESGYTETGGGTGIDLIIDDRNSTSFSSTALLTVGAMFERPDRWWAPHFRLGYRSEFADDMVETNARFDGYTDTFTLTNQALPGTGFIFGFGVGAGSGYSTFSFDYDADVRDDFVRHTARLVMRMVF